MFFRKNTSLDNFNLTLAYDSSCGMCVETARSVQMASGDKISVAPLNGEYVSEAFKMVGKEVSYEKPVIVLEKDNFYKIYDGYKLGLVLASHLGIQKTWKVLERLGDRKNYSNSGRTLSRKSFLRAALGAASAAAVLSGVQPASAKNLNSNPLRVDWFENIHIENSRELSDLEARELVSYFVERSISGKIELDEQILNSPDSTIRGVLHKAKDEKIIKAVSIETAERVYFLYEGLGISSETLYSSRVLELSGTNDDTVRLLSASEGDSVALYSRGSSNMSSGCDSNACRKKGRCYGCACTSWDLKCLANCCATCAFSCGNPWSCLACVGIWCVVCSNWTNPCCKARACRYIDRSTC